MALRGRMYITGSLMAASLLLLATFSCAPSEQNKTPEGSSYYFANFLGRTMSSFYSTPEPPRKNKKGQPTGRPTVHVLVADTCPFCHATIEFLVAQEIPFSVHDIEKNTTAGSVYQKLGGGGVPLLIIGNQVVKGFHPGEIMATYESQMFPDISASISDASQ